MAAIALLVRALLSFIPNLPMAGDELDEATREFMQQRALYVNAEMTRLLQDIEDRSVEQKTQEQCDFAWGALLSTASEQWHFCVIAGVLVLLFGLCWVRFRNRSREAESSSTEERCCCKTVNVEEEQELEQEEEESEGESADDERDLGWTFERRFFRRVQNPAYIGLVVEDLVAELLWLFQKRFCNSFFPVLQRAIGVGSTFEAWDPCEDSAVYQLLVPLKAPRGHRFQLEMGTTGQMPVKTPRIYVELECTCTGQQNMLCFLHHSEEGLTRNQDPSLLHILCTGSYLDVQKTALWFQTIVMSTWMDVSLSRCYNMEMLPSSRSCKLQLTGASRRTLFIELIFGVQQGDSDIFLSSQAAEDTFNASTTWSVTYAVAEVKFFRHMARKASARAHLKCLQTCACILTGTSFSTYDFKTAVMHLLTTTPLSRWCRKNFLLRLQDTMRYMRWCLEEKRLNHFFLGNENVPEEISLPLSFKMAEPLNLFQRFAQDPAACADALCDFIKLEHRLIRQLVLGYWERAPHTEL
ncbi:LOW QUALITY PROTEIN: inositol 1,4,5-trisphosphate receptor-interacting protein-like 1 [Cuculus canorus]|uniref:LOW QUALITY PROTEIN: inositol 1,4,5-trisphosphate receptor-interacting protein-like 1 n=1 Tax=Cuculus canorus TaxID=55661 RepID=UPI0023AADE17|nr:LOW QUALITY PROTEIN: inositol 1,4,5-trisphosphate receptor-interacting protein-like 1 [Cuculus canorus]